MSKTKIYLLSKSNPTYADSIQIRFNFIINLFRYMDRGGGGSIDRGGEGTLGEGRGRGSGERERWIHGSWWWEEGAGGGDPWIGV